MPLVLLLLVLLVPQTVAGLGARIVEVDLPHIELVQSVVRAASGFL